MLFILCLYCKTVYFWNFPFCSNSAVEKPGNTKWWRLTSLVMSCGQDVIQSWENIRQTPSLVAQVVKNMPAMQETQVRSLNWEDPLGRGMAAHSSMFGWRIPMDRGAWQATVHGVTKSQTWLSAYTHINPNWGPFYKRSDHCPSKCQVLERKEQEIDVNWKRLELTVTWGLIMKEKKGHG